MEILDNDFVLYPTRGLKCAGCKLGENYYSSGYRCFRSGLFFHEECCKSTIEIKNPYHPQHVLKLTAHPEDTNVFGECKICRGNLAFMYYSCTICHFTIDLICAKKEVPVRIVGLKIHEHPLSLVPNMIMFTCHLCEMSDEGFPYACNLCDLSFHKDCAESTPELSYPCHPKHPLKRLTRVPSYIDEKCCLCGNKLHIVFYHCSICDFNIDVDCAKDPPPFILVSIKTHEHKLILMPRRSFVCNACGIHDDSNPYVCSECNYMIHRSCINIPSVIKINRHSHRIHYKSYLEAGNWKCGVCHKKIRWDCGAYSCSQCQDFNIHVRCATKFGIWDGIDLEGISENTMDVEPYKVIKEGVIEHFSHKNHALKLKEMSGANDQYMWCKACTYPVFSNSFYSCMKCDDFILHKKCAYLPKKITDSFYKMTMNLHADDYAFCCEACQNICEGFRYTSETEFINLDVRCGSISEPLSHDSHHGHSLFINYTMKDMLCDACGDNATMGLSCEDCRFALHIKCSNLPKLVKHRFDADHFLSLCYGEITSEQYICEICEEELNPKKWFYSCAHCGITIHTRCTLGDFIWFKPEDEDTSSNVYVILNNHSTRPICDWCDSCCQFPSILKFFAHTLCSLQCLQKIYKFIVDRHVSI